MLVRTALTLMAITPVAAAMAASSEATSAAVLSPGRSYVESDGASLYANVCQGCHMRDGRGAIGAAAYPSLVANPDLHSTAFVVGIVLVGLRAMPPVGRTMSDDQVAATVNYVRNHFGTFSDDPATVASVQALRPRKAD